ncbi:MAG: S1C family serine protease [Actinomycetes bacterium]
MGTPPTPGSPGAWTAPPRTQPQPPYAGYGGQPLPGPGPGTPSSNAWPNTPYGSPAFSAGPEHQGPHQGPQHQGPQPGGGPVVGRRGGRLRIGLAGLVAGALIGGGAGAGVATLVDDPAPAAAGGTAPPAQSVVIENPETATTATAAAAKAAPSVVTVYMSSSSGSGSGSGVVLTDDGYVLTNNHVVAGEGGGAGSVQVRTADGTLYDATIVGTDPASDLAVLRLDGAEGLDPATFADSDGVQIGDVAVAIGAPLGLSNTVTTGIISATGRAVATGSTQDDATVLDAIQTDAAINPGNSGGALVDGAGEVIGINTAIATVASGLPGAESRSGNIGVGFAIPSNTAQRIAQEIIENGSATRAYLGVRARTEADDQNSEVGAGARIETVEQGSAAAEAGLQPSDVVTAVGDRPITTSTELTAAVRSQAPGEEVELTVRRGDDVRTVELTLGSTS